MTNVATDPIGGDAGKTLENLLTDTSQPTRVRATAKTESTEDRRFAGKTREQVIEMYSNLDSHAGRLANSLGQTQNQLTEALAVAKRNADIRDNTNAPADKAVNAMELLADPNKALNDLLDKHTTKIKSEYDTRINRLEGELARSRFERNHPDAQQLFNDPAVAQFAQGTPLRASLAQRAVQGDAQAADALLTEFKQYKSTVAEPAASKGAGEAANISLESGRSSTDAASGSGGRVYTRSEIRNLLQTDPEKYYSDAVQSALMTAHREGRVRGE